MPTILKDAEIQAISLVDRGANLKKFFLFKRADDAHGQTASGGGFESSVAANADRGIAPIIKKADGPNGEWSVAYCLVAVPNEVDQQGDVWSEDEIEKAAHDFVAGGGLINFMHKTMEPVGELVQSAVAPQDMNINGEHIPKGSWYIAVRPNAEMKKAIETGEITGISVQGSAKREPVFTPGIDSPGTMLHTVAKAGVRTMDGKAIKEGQPVHLVQDPSRSFIVLGEHPQSGKLVLGSVDGENIQVDGLDLITPQTAQAKLEQEQANSAPAPMQLQYAPEGKSPFEHLYNQQGQPEQQAAAAPQQQQEQVAIGKAEAALDGTPGVWRTIRGGRAFVATEGDKEGQVIAGPGEMRGTALQELSKRPDLLPNSFEQPIAKDARGRVLHRGDSVSHILNEGVSMPVVEVLPDGVVVEVEKAGPGYPFPMQSMVSPRQLVFNTGPVGGKGGLDDLANALIQDFDENEVLRDAMGRFGIYDKDQIEDAIATGQLREEDVRELIKLVDGAADASDDRNREGSVAVGQGRQQSMYKAGDSEIDDLVRLLNTPTPEDGTMDDTDVEKAAPKHPASKCAVGGCKNCIDADSDVEKAASLKGATVEVNGQEGIVTEQDGETLTVRAGDKTMRVDAGEVKVVRRPVSEEDEEAMEKGDKPFPGAAEPFGKGKKRKKHEMGLVDGKGDQYLPGGEQVKDADLKGLSSPVTKCATCGSEEGGEDGLCKSCGKKHMEKASMCKCGGALNKMGVCEECGEVAKGSGEMPHEHGAGEHDAYMAEQKRKKRPVSDEDDEDDVEKGNRAFPGAAAPFTSADGKKRLRPMQANDGMDEEMSKAADEDPRALKLLSGGKRDKEMSEEDAMSTAANDTAGASVTDQRHRGKNNSSPQVQKAGYGDSMSGGGVTEDRYEGENPGQPRKRRFAARIGHGGEVEKHFDLGNPHQHPHDEGGDKEPGAGEAPKRKKPRLGDEGTMRLGQEEPTEKAGGFPPSRTPDQPMGGQQGKSPEADAVQAEQKKPTMNHQQKQQMLQELMQVAQSGDKALLQMLEGMNVQPEQLAMLDVPDDQLKMLHEKFVQGPGRRSSTPQVPGNAFKKPNEAADGLTKKMAEAVAKKYGFEVEGGEEGDDAERRKKRLQAKGENVIRGQGTRLGGDGAVLKVADDITPGKMFVGPDDKRYIAKQVTETSVVGFAGGEEVRVPRGQVRLAHGSLSKSGDKVGDRLPFPDGLLAEDDGKKAGYTAGMIVKVPGGHGEVLHTQGDGQVVVIVAEEGNLPRRRVYPAGKVSLAKAGVKKGDIVKLKDGSAAQVDDVEGDQVTIIQVSKDLKEKKRTVAASDLEVMDPKHGFAKSAPRPGSMHGQDPKKHGKIRHIVRQFGKWAGGKHTICVNRLRVEHPEVAKGREARLCFAPGTLVETRDRGMVPIEEIMPLNEATGEGDWVRTHLGVWRPVIATRANRAGDRKLYRFAVENQDRVLEVTEDHNMLVARGVEFSEGGRVRKRSSVARAAAGIETPTRSTTTTPLPPAALGSVEKAEARDVNECDYLLFPKTRDVYDAEVSDDFLRLVGLFAAEGSHLDSSSSVRWCFGIEEPLAKECQEIAEREFGHKFRIVRGPTSDVVTLDVGQPGAAADVRERLNTAISGNSWSKRFASWVLDLPTERLRVVLQGYWDGDGHTRPSGRENVATTVSRDLAHQVRNMLVYLGERPRIKQVRDAREDVIEGRVVKGAPTWAVSYTPREHESEGGYRRRHAGLETDEYIAFPIQSIEVVDAPEWVYALQVEQHASVVVAGLAAFNCAWLKDQWAGTTHWRRGNRKGSVRKDFTLEAPPQGAEIEDFDPDFEPSLEEIEGLFLTFCEIFDHDPDELEAAFERLDGEELDAYLDALDEGDDENVEDSLDDAESTSSTLTDNDLESSREGQSAAGLDRAREVFKRALGIQPPEEARADGEIILKAVESLTQQLVSAAGEDDDHLRKSRTDDVLSDFGRWFGGYVDDVTTDHR